MLSIFATTLTPNAAAKEELFNLLSFDIPSIADTTCSSVFDVKSYLPIWLVEENDSLEEGEPSLVKFLQYYFDWLHCSKESSIFSTELFDFIYPTNLNDKTVTSALKSFIPGLVEILETYNYDLPIENAINILIGVKTNTFQRKTTSACVSLFFSKLFNEITGVISSTDSNNKITIQYLITEESETSNFKSMLDEIYEELLHPFGFEYESSLQTFTSQSFFNREDGSFERSFSKPEGVTLTAWDLPVLGNYYVYNMGDTATIGSTSGCSGSTHPRAVTGNTANMPTYNHPDWYKDIVSGASFGSINIFDFIAVEYNSTNPNLNITGC